MMVQFCSNSVTGTMIAPALACWVLGVVFLGHGEHNADFCRAAKQKESWLEPVEQPRSAVTRPSQLRVLV